MSLLVLILLNELLMVFGARYTDKWAVKINGGEAAARRLSEKYGFTYLGKIIPDVYHFQHKDVQKRSAHPSTKQHRLLFEDPEVLWTEQQIIKRRVSRSMTIGKREYNVLYSDPSFPNDPKWQNMWYLNGDSDYDMGIRETWELGYTGKGVVVTIVDDGIEINHVDLKQNYDAEASYDVNDHDTDPTPRYDFSDVNRHGTRCAGVVAAVGNNKECVIGVAFNSSIGGIRMLDGDVTDAVEAESLSFRQDYIDIYSASWGPTDNGRTVDGPGPLTWEAIENAIKTGRRGLGNIFVWASGNGGNHNDNCNCDGYTNSIYTLSVSAVTKSNKIPWFSESCSSTIATAAGSGNSDEKWLTTTDIRQSCTEYHSGTSASVAIGAGICALVLEANPNLTWRDMQHIVVLAARKSTLISDDWIKNGVGKDVSHAYGFGLMDSLMMVRLAKIWNNVSPQHICRIDSTYNNVTVGYDETFTMTLSTNGCHGNQNYIRFLEHVQVEITINAIDRRGELEIYLTSPMGTRSTLLSRRPSDYRPGVFEDYPFMTVHSWGENPSGTWLLEIKNGGTNSNVTNWSLVLMGTDIDPKQGLPTGIFNEEPINSSSSTTKTTTTTTTTDLTSVGVEKVYQKHLCKNVQGCQSQQKGRCRSPILITEKSKVMILVKCTTEIVQHKNSSGIIKKDTRIRKPMLKSILGLLIDTINPQSSMC